jgi:hypothetical protein
MRHRAALFGAALAAGGFALIAGPSPADTIGILSLIDPGCCSVHDGSNLQIDPDGAAKGKAFAVTQIPSVDDGRSETGVPKTVNDISKDGSERAGDSLGPEAVSLKVSAGSDDNASDGASSVATAEPSVLSWVLLIFADLRATVVRGP